MGEEGGWGSIWFGAGRRHGGFSGRLLEEGHCVQGKAAPSVFLTGASEALRRAQEQSGGLEAGSGKEKRERGRADLGDWFSRNLTATWKLLGYRGR